MSSSPSSSSSYIRATLIILGCLLLHGSFSNAQLTPSFYKRTCPSLFTIIRNVIVERLKRDPRITGSILRLHFHDCFVNGCDASVLLDNSTSFRTEKDAAPNANSARGFDVIDQMKAAVEKACPKTVSCADLLTIAAEESVFLSGGPRWAMPLGRRDSLEAFFDLSNTALPGPSFTLDQLKASFRAVGLDRSSDLVALSAGHTFGRAKCLFVLDRLYNFNNTGLPDPTLNKTYRAELRKLCPQNGNISTLVNFDVTTPDVFDNKFYSNLRVGKGLIQSDQELFSTPKADTIALVKLYSENTTAFFQAFIEAMIRMGNIKPLTGKKGEIRLNCRVVNSKIKDVDNDEGLVSSI